MVDAESGDHVELLRSHAARNSELVVEEALPSPDDCWLTGGGKRYAAELVVSLFRNSAEDQGAGPSHAVKASGHERPVKVDRRDRLLAPGSDWMYMRLYLNTEEQDAVLCAVLPDLVNSLDQGKLIDNWFFLRYADPEPHLRIRFEAKGRSRSSEVLCRCSEWATRLVNEGCASRFSFDTYDREIERYGGLPGVQLAERIWGADSAAIVALIGIGFGQYSALELATLTIDNLLRDPGLGIEERLEFYAAHCDKSPDAGRAYRNRQQVLRDLHHIARVDEEPNSVISAILSIRSDLLRDVGATLRQIRLSRSLSGLYRDYVHLHCNRLGIDPGLEQVALDLTQRVVRSLSIISG